MSRMKTSKRRKLKVDGWKIGSASDFLELSEAEEALVTMKLAHMTRDEWLLEAVDLLQIDFDAIFPDWTETIQGKALEIRFQEISEELGKYPQIKEKS